jgi:hypothetical protein
MTRLTGPKKKSKYADKQCEYCKRWFHNLPIHQRMGSACKELRK